MEQITQKDNVQAFEEELYYYSVDGHDPKNRVFGVGKMSRTMSRERSFKRRRRSHFDAMLCNGNSVAGVRLQQGFLQRLNCNEKAIATSISNGIIEEMQRNVPLQLHHILLQLLLFKLQPLLFLEIERPKLFNHCPADFVAGRSGNRGGPSRTRGNGFCLLSSDRSWNGVLVIGSRNVEGRDLIGRTDGLVDLNLASTVDLFRNDTPSGLLSCCHFGERLKIPQISMGTLP
ncbi:unnamed protein product [Cuscuta campestris]|uniref:Uncharacterized protein n=1 Tax=Cuscuta campestris TaxID=132261 RepID=A0A484LUV2_9ASTE|nr:unnamed protein product [Cuscuta campestris]